VKCHQQLLTKPQQKEEEEEEEKEKNTAGRAEYNIPKIKRG
jgi:hypothetical protein